MIFPTKKLFAALALVPTLALAEGECNEPLYLNTQLTAAERADDLLHRLTLEEKVQLMTDVSEGIDRLGIKRYNWWNEALHGVARSGLGTVFPQPIGMAATFDPEAVNVAFSAISDEARAKNTQYAAEGSYERYQGLTFWTPTVNLFRDPRWGRGIETYGEDPFLTSRMGVEVVRGLQGPAGSKYDKLHACAKHFAVHSGPEWNRHIYNAENISMRDLYETYLPQFEALVKEGNVKEVMCAYNRYEGEPCCGSKRLLTQILREDWGYKGIILSDCWAINDFFTPGAHNTYPDGASAAAAAVLSGTDLECGSTYLTLVDAAKRGLISEKDIDVSVRRLLTARFALGLMDNAEEVEWTKIPYSVVASDKHKELALQMARKSMTLLYNKEKTLPLQKDLTIAVIGPNANDSVMQWGNYNGTPAATTTILQAIEKAVAGKGKVIYQPACGLVGNTMIESVFGQCATKNGQGIDAQYWNNINRSGKPVAVQHYTSPTHLCTSGATVFAPGVNLTDFSALYTTTFTAKKAGPVTISLYANGKGCIKVDGKVVQKYMMNHGSRNVAYIFEAKANKKYEIEIEFEYLYGDAQFNLDLGGQCDVVPAEVVDGVRNADVVVFVGGISPSLEGEEMGVDLPGFRGGDRTDIELPAIQRSILTALKAAGKKVVLVNCSGSPIGLEPEMATTDAILQAWYPGQEGGTAVADVLFGDYNPAGRLPVTFYKNVSQLPDFEDYNMAGRTYRYMTEAPLFAFGYGLSYASFAYGEASLASPTIKNGESLRIIIPVENTSAVAGDEVVQVYLALPADQQGPRLQLRGFAREAFAAGEKRNVEIEIPARDLRWFSETTQKLENMAGNYVLYYGSSSRAEDLKSIDFVIE